MNLVKQLQAEAERIGKQLDSVKSAISILGGKNSGGAGGNGRKSGNGRRKKRYMSAAGRRAIARAQRARWAKVKAKKNA